MRERGGYISTKANSDGTDSPYELNISYFDAFRDPTGDNRWHIPMFMASQIIALSFQGIPAVYIHCLTATPNDTLGVERTGMTRAVNRRKWDKAELEYLIGDLASETGQVFTQFSRLLETRRAQPAFHPDAPQRIIDLDERIFCFERIATDGTQRILVVANLVAESLAIARERLPADLEQREDVLGLNNFAVPADALRLEPYAVFWLSLETS